MNTVNDILQTKGSFVWSVAPDSKVYDALKLMAEKNIGAVLVMESGKVEGIFSERDYARKVVLEGKSSRELPVREIMSSRVLFVTGEESVDECMALMIEKKIRHLPVYEETKLKGLISIGDVVKALLDHKEFTIGQLEQYITNRR
ncbi:MAG: Inosine-5'-monophosphate dehydrogenase [Ignavibacteriaceae bacterium]|nr:Inosine-5'-monophosphate dehydrogenase [Ignavibacteriaceae bacterium]